MCLCFRYLHRFDSELEQIELVNGIKGRQGRLHGARETVIMQTVERERAQFDGNGFGKCYTSLKIHTFAVLCPSVLLKINCCVFPYPLPRDSRSHQLQTSEDFQVSIHD